MGSAGTTQAPLSCPLLYAFDFRTSERACGCFSNTNSGTSDNQIFQNTVSFIKVKTDQNSYYTKFSEYIPYFISY